MEVEQIIDNLVEDLKAGKEPDLDAFNEEQIKALLTRVREKIDQLKRFHESGHGPLEGEHLGKFATEQNALIGLRMRLDPDFTQNLADSIANFFDK